MNNLNDNTNPEATVAVDKCQSSAKLWMKQTTTLLGYFCSPDVQQLFVKQAPSQRQS
jgi:hypothetical protein